MRKKLLVSSITAALIVGAASSTFAASNPFSDVPKDSWAYEAVTTLANDGVIDGFPNGTFQGNKNMTRYEMAQIIAKAMTKENMSKADKTLVQKLASEFAQELNNLGVRVADLEEKSDNVKITGDVRIRFEGRNQHGIYLNDAQGKNLHAEKFTDAEVSPLSDIDVINKTIPDNKVYNEFINGLHLNIPGAPNPLPEDSFRNKYLSLNEIYVPDPRDFPPIPQGLTHIQAAILKYKGLENVVKKAKENNIPKPAITLFEEALDKAKKNYEVAMQAQNLPEYAAMLKQFANKADSEKESSYRLRFNLTSNISDKTEVGARFVANFDMDADSNSELTYDRLWVNHNFSEGNSIKLGRIGAFIGDGLIYDDSYDGIIANAKIGKTKLEVGTGYPLAIVNSPKTIHQTMTFAQITAPVAKDIEAKAFATRLSSSKTDSELLKKFGIDYLGFKQNIYGISLSGNHGQFGWNAAYAKRTVGKDNVVYLPLIQGAKGLDAWTVGTSYQNGPAKFVLQYFKLGVNSPILSSTYDLRYIKNWKGFVATAEYDFSKNVHGKLSYSFKGSPVEKYQGAIDPAAQYYAQVEYNF